MECVADFSVTERESILAVTEVFPSIVLPESEFRGQDFVISVK